MSTLTPNLNPHELAKSLGQKQLINGQLVPPFSGQSFTLTNPATGQKITDIAAGDARDVDAAVSAAKAAQKTWGALPARERGKKVQEAARLLLNHVEEIARLIALETGKALRTESRVEANVLADAFHFFGGLGSELKGETVPFSPTMLTLTVRQPVGVVGAIIPWNVPLLLMALKVAPALVAGNAVVVKSAEEAPLAVLRVCQIMNEVLPPGLFNMLAGDGPTCGAPLVQHKDVKKISFTGSVETGKIVYKMAAEKLIPVTLELGGKSPMIILADADLEQAVQGAVVGMRFTRQGQSCTAASRIFIHESLHDAFVEKLKAKVDALKMGDPLDEATDIGTIISTGQFDKVTAYIDIGQKTSGAKMHVASNLPQEPHLAHGLFIQPRIFTHLPLTSPLVREEIFGPVTCIFKFSDVAEALHHANDTDYGLAGTIWTRNLGEALRLSHALEAGFVQVNQNVVVQPGLSYGGIKLSGLGKEATLEAMLEHFTYKKTIILNMNS